jgi:hypothetical protein
MCRHRDPQEKINPGTRGGNGANHFGHRNFHEFVQKNFPTEKPKENLPFRNKKKE